MRYRRTGAGLSLAKSGNRMHAHIRDGAYTVWSGLVSPRHSTDSRARARALCTIVGSAKNNLPRLHRVLALASFGLRNLTRTGTRLHRELPSLPLPPPPPLLPSLVRSTYTLPHVDSRCVGAGRFSAFLVAEDRLKVRSFLSPSRSRHPALTLYLSTRHDNEGKFFLAVGPVGTSRDLWSD